MLFGCQKEDCMKQADRFRAMGLTVAVTLLIPAAMSLGQSTAGTMPPIVATFSIVGRDSVSGELGVAVASRFFAVGSVVPWAKADVGAVATQSFANTTFGWRGLDLLEKGASPEEIVSILLRNDPNPTKRQFGIVSADGQSATYTGK